MEYCWSVLCVAGDEGARQCAVPAHRLRWGVPDGRVPSLPRANARLAVPSARVTCGNHGAHPLPSSQTHYMGRHAQTPLSSESRGLAYRRHGRAHGESFHTLGICMFHTNWKLNSCIWILCRWRIYFINNYNIYKTNRGSDELSLQSFPVILIYR